MKIKLTNGELSQSLLPALIELRQISAGVRLQYNCLKSLKACQESILTLEEERKKIVEESALMENGKPKVEGNEYVFETPEKKQEVISKINELFSLETEVDMWQLPFSEADGLKMTGDLLSRLMGKFFIEPNEQ